MSSNPIISIIINCFNSERYLEETIQSVINQSFNDWELIFWDNLSNDNTSNIIKAHKDSRIRYMQASEHVSLGEARNYALEKAKGQYVAFLDSDDLWDPDFLSRTIEYIIKEDVGLVYTRFYYFNEKQEWPSASYQKEGYVSIEKLIESYNIGMSAAIFKKKIVEDNYIRFDNRFSLIEDLDFFLQIAINSKTFFVDDFLMKYRCHNNNLSLSDRWVKELDMFLDKINNCPKLCCYKTSIRRRREVYKYQIIKKNKGSIQAFLYSVIHLPGNQKMLKYSLESIIGRQITNKIVMFFNEH